MLKVINVVGARPNFMKVAPIMEAMKRRKREFAPLLVHTGQHFDAQMSDFFFRDLRLPDPDVHLGVGAGTHAAQTAAVMEGFEPILMRERPDWVVVVGDVNSTLAGALVAAKLHIKVAHVEAGLRSRDRRMPEEINRVLTDQISDLLLTPSVDADANLRHEGISPERIRMVGNVMIDSLYAHLEQAARSTVRQQLELDNRDYAVVTLHRPSNVDDPATLKRIVGTLETLGARLPIVFPVHPRTRQRLAHLSITLDAQQLPSSVSSNKAVDATAQVSGVRMIEPLGYLNFLRLYSGARLVLTDSGGVQEETTALGIPCLTLRDNTERPITIEMGTNKLVGTDSHKIISAAERVLAAPRHELSSGYRVPPLWDGHTAERICDALIQHGLNAESSIAERGFGSADKPN